MILCMWFLLFSFWVFCGIVLMFWFMGVLSLSQNIFFFKMVYVSGIVSHLKFTFPDHFLIHVILSWVISVLSWYFCTGFVWEFLWRMFYLYNMYYVQCIYLSGIQGSVICVVDRNQILCDVTFWDHIVHPTCMVDGLQLQYWHSFSIYHISQTIWHRYRWYCLLHIFEHFCHIKFQFSFFVYVIIKL